MDIGARITKRIEDGALKQSALAAQFVERAKARGAERNRVTVESHLSRLKSNDRTAAQFFFGDPRDADDLLEVLAFPAEERPAVLDAANDLLAPAERPARIVVDLTTAPRDRTFVDVCESLHQALLDGAPPRVVLVMTETQRDFLLPKYAPQNRVSVEVVDDAEAGKAHTGRLAGEVAFVVSSWRFPDLARWIAVRWPKGPHAEFALDPSNGRELLRLGRPAFDGAAAGPHDLSALAPAVAAEAPPKELVWDGVALRQLLVALQRGELVNHPLRTPAARQSWAKHLGVRAAATPHEWVEHLVAVATDAGAVGVWRGTEQHLREEMTRVERGAKTPRVVVVGMDVHVINPVEGTVDRLGALPGVTVHTVTPRVSAVTLLRGALAKTSQQALLDDPYLERMVSDLVKDGADRTELAFVAACVLADDKVAAPEAPRMRAWLDALRAVMALDPPAVGLRLPRAGQEGTTLCSPPGGRSIIGSVLAAAPPRLHRGGSCMIGSLETARQDYRGDYGDAPYQLPRGLSFDDGLAVFDAFDRSPFRSGKQPPSDRWVGTALTFEDDFWREADRHLATTWLALRRATKVAEAVTLHEGVGMLEMGSGLLAEVSAYEVPPHPREVPCEADLLLPVFDEEFKRIPNHLYGGHEPYPYRAIPARKALQDLRPRTAYSTMKVPHAVYLAHGVARIVVTFRVTPWDTMTSPATQLLGVAGAAAARDAEDDD